jgi:hypothetical protein
MNDYVKSLQRKFISLTSNFSINDWRKIRDKSYWEESDRLVDPIKKLQYKIGRIEQFLINEQNFNQ